MTLEAGAIVDGRFEVLELLGEGGLAQVYKVRHSALGSVYALKLLSWKKKRLAERLLLEGRIQAQLNHPNIVAVTDIVRHDGQFGLLMEYVPNESLEEWLVKRGGLGVKGALELFAPILAAVSAAHDAGVLHRDLKPANVLLAVGARGVVPKVTDFGIAKVVADMAEGGTAVGATMGTPGYLAPEQVQDSSTIDARADVFALGAIAWEMITGARAFADENGRVTLASTVQVVPPLVSHYLPEVAPHIDAALARAMERDPAARFSDCRAFAQALYADQPDLLALVEGQAPTGLLSLSGVREALERSLSGGEPRQGADPTTNVDSVAFAAPVSQPTLHVTGDPEPAPSGGMSMGLLALAGLGMVLGAAALAGVAMAVLANGMMPDPDVGEPVPVAVPAPPPLPVPVVQPEPVAPADSDGVAEVPVPEASDPQPVAPSPAVAPVPAPVPAPSPVPAEAPEPVPEPEPAPEPVPAPSPAPPPEPVVPAPAVPVPVAAPVAAAPSVQGTWTGTANKLPFTLQVSQEAGAISGQMTFGGFQSRQESFRGTIGSDGAVRFQGSDLSFTGTLTDGRMSGTYIAGRGKPLVWDVTR